MTADGPHRLQLWIVSVWSWLTSASSLLLAVFAGLHLTRRSTGTPRSLCMATDLRRKIELPEITDRILQTYSDMGSISHLGHCPLPSTEVVIDIALDLKEVLFPGYHRRQN